MRIQQSGLSDVDTHMTLYEKAIAYQQALGYHNWVSFDRSAIEKEIQAGKQYKVVSDDGRVIGVFLIEESDPVLWGDRDSEPAVYLHRVVVDPDCRGGRVMDFILAFLRANFGTTKKYIRMDTKAGNDRLNKYYTTKCGFALLKEIQIGTEPSLPLHYHNRSIVLFESKM